jgi:hypothetical protein
MAIENEIQNFISEVQNRIRTERAFERTIEDQISKKCTWDVAAKRRIGTIVKEVLIA